MIPPDQTPPSTGQSARPQPPPGPARPNQPAAPGRPNDATRPVSTAIPGARSAAAGSGAPDPAAPASSARRSAPPPGRPPGRRAKSTSLPLRILLAVLTVSGICLAGLAAYFVFRQFSLAWPGELGALNPSFTGGEQTPQVNELGTPLPPLPGAEDPALAPLSTLTPWDGAGRVTVLLLGLDERDWQSEDKYARSDTMMLVTLDPQAKTAGMLSIPRDLWVAIPGFKHGKINTAYYLGDAYQLPGGGPALAVKTVEQFLGVPINYYAQVDFGAFVRFIDEIGGVEIDVPAPITIDLLGTGAKTKKKLQPGRQVLPGAWALAYARNRYTEGGDFDRAARQQQVIMAIRDRILSVDMLQTLITKAPTLYQELSSGVRTNLSLEEVIQLAVLAQGVPDNGIQRGIINKDNVFFGQSPDGLSILIPIPDDINALRDEIFATAGSLGPQTPGSITEQVKAEAAKVALYNASGVPGFGERAASFLRGQGANIVQVSDGGQAAGGTTIIDHTGNPYILKYIAELFNVPAARIQVKFDPASSVDVEVYLGGEAPNKNVIP